jgi:hypothetical protein
MDCFGPEARVSKQKKRGMDMSGFSLLSQKEEKLFRHFERLRIIANRHRLAKLESLATIHLVDVLTTNDYSTSPVTLRQLHMVNRYKSDSYKKLINIDKLIIGFDSLAKKALNDLGWGVK